MHRPLIKSGVMGSASTSITAAGLQRVDELAVRLGKKIAAAACVLITGELDGIPGRVVEVHSQCGGLSVGVSPASSAAEHAALFTTPPCPSTIVIYSGFGFKGIHTNRDKLPSIAYSEELISCTISATLQSTDRRHGIVGQERCHFQLDS
jgi:hypothetical protein